jgi:glycosyltransferase involved in cell wall biosynthesis
VKQKTVDMPYPDSPKVTVLMSVLDGEKYIKPAIDSVLSQTFADFEFLIINDGSTDKTCEFIKCYDDPRIKLVHNMANIGLTKSLNTGLRLALGEYIARMDYDDISMPKRLEDQVKYLDEHPEVMIVGGQFDLIDSGGSVLPIPPVKKAPGMEGLLLHLAIDNPFVHSSVMFRKDAVMELGGYNEEYRTSQDIELWSRLLCSYKGANLQSKVVHLRVHDSSVSSGRYKVQQGDNREMTIRRGTNLMLSNLRRIIPESKVPDEWINLYVGIYVENWPESRYKANLLLDGMNNIRKYASCLAQEDRKYAMQMISSKLYLISVHLLRSYFLTVGLYALVWAFLSDWKFIIKMVKGTAVNLLRRKCSYGQISAIEKGR